MNRPLQTRVDGEVTTQVVRQIVLHVVGPLLCGAVIYVCFRSTGLGLFNWIRRAGMIDLTFRLRSLSHPVARYLPAWVVFSLPDGLWTYTATATALLLSTRNSLASVPSWPIAVWIGPAAIGVGELLQGLGVVPGTADPIDLCLASLGAAGAVWALHPTRRPLASAQAGAGVSRL